jgi:NAD(P)-dependent dehydrogenase (short-subunit alcohol dehydrogenase family)
MMGRQVLITGGSRGIGAAIAVRLLADGHRVTTISRSGTGPSGARHLAVDVTDEAALSAAFAPLERIDVLVNNAGAAESAPFARQDQALLRRMLALNLESAFTASRLVLPAMTAQGWGRIINIASTAGLKGYPYVAAYVAAKHGLVGLTRALALEVAKSGVTVNAVCPGFTETDLVSTSVEKIMAKTGRSEAEARAELSRSNPLNRMVQPQEVAAAVAYLVCDEAGAVNGVALPVAGGEV